jgi:DNA-binding NarL/FixJ family response regulator
MNESILDGLKILAVDDEPDVLDTLETVIKTACPRCQFDKAATFDEAADLLKASHFDIVILDIMGVRGFELLEIAVKREFKVVMLTAHAFSPEALRKSHDMGARAYVPKEKMGEIIPFLEDVLKYDHSSGWKRLLYKLENYFDDRFDSGWKKKADPGYWW